MALFGRKKKKRELEEDELPKLPELPKLSRLPGFTREEDYSEMIVPQLPRYPATKLGDKFSQNTIREAVTGKKEEEVEADEFDEEEIDETQMMSKLPKLKSFPSEIEIPSRTKFKPKSKSPVFIRVDKFEQALGIFNQAKEKIYEMEKLLSEINELKRKEEKELSDWSVEIQSMKNQIEKVEEDIFSKVE